MPPKVTHFHGFTLTELLTTVAVIGLLLAIIVAAYPSGLAIARETKCKSNLRNIGQAYQALRLDEKNDMGVMLAAASWSDDLLPYLGKNINALLCPEDEEYTSTGLPPARIRVNDYGHPNLYEVELFNVYPYWLEGSHADFGYRPAVWRVNTDVYESLGIDHDSGFGGAPGFSYHAPSNALPKYSVGPDASRYWYLMEDQRGGEGDTETTGDGSLNDLHVYVEELGHNQYRCTFYKDPASIYWCDLLLNDRAWADPKDEKYETSENEIASIGRYHRGPFVLRGQGVLSYGMTSQIEDIPHSAHKLIVLDYEARVCMTGYAVGLDTGWDSLKAPRHRGKANAVASDGSVASYLPDLIDPERTESSATYWSPDE
jgi:prepilin-type N-terminal cleavage/methylation domain-containing protein